MHHRKRRRGSNLWSRGLAFPLERLHTLIANGVWSDEHSQMLWESAYDVPYQLWPVDPESGADLRLQDVMFTCPWCSKPGYIKLEPFTRTHITKASVSGCPSC